VFSITYHLQKKVNKNERRREVLTRQETPETSLFHLLQRYQNRCDYTRFKLAMDHVN